MESSFDYLRAHAAELGSRILETYPPLQSTKDPLLRMASLLRKALPAQGLAITGLPSICAKQKAARIVRRVRRGQDLYGFGHNPCSGGWAAQYHAGYVPIAYHAQMGARGLADDTASPRLPHRGHAQWRRSQPAARHLRGEAE